ncbi:MAG: uncharacterized protein QG657_533 [Acidobacteriota bacterium]|nr:uncharacterized protein [Acidobacteriota bacterium]
MILDACGKRIESKTKLHKIAYFLSILLKKDFQFNAYYYGPYSRPIEEGLGELTGAGFLSVSMNSYGLDSTHGFEKKRYDYNITEDGEALLKHLKTEYAREYETIAKYTNFLKEKNYFDLSIAAKSYFIIEKEKQPVTSDQICLKAREFHWNISQSEIDSAIKILMKLDFIKEN